jgi:hypothetical protein
MAAHVDSENEYRLVPAMQEEGDASFDKDHHFLLQIIEHADKPVSFKALWTGNSLIIIFSARP